MVATLSMCTFNGQLCSNKVIDFQHDGIDIFNVHRVLFSLKIKLFDMGTSTIKF